MRKTNEYIDCGEYTKFIVNSPKHGTFEVVIDVNLCKQHYWCIYYSNRGDGKYISYYVVSPKGVSLQRLLMDAPKGRVVDHIDGDTLNNRRYNLRVCKHNENGKNRKLNRNNKSGHKGVCWSKEENKWMAYIKVNYCHHTLGYFDNINDAIICREKYEREYFGEFRRDIT